MQADATPPPTHRPRLLDRIDRVPPPRERWRQRLRRILTLTGIVLGALLLVALVILARVYLESRWTLPETHITARVEEDLQYNITYDPEAGDRIRNINFTTNEIIHLGNPDGGIEAVLARAERNQTENRHTYELKNDRDLKVATATELRVAKRPLVDKTEIVAAVENGTLIHPQHGERRRVYRTYGVSGKRLHERTLTTTIHDGADIRPVNTLAEYSEWWGWFGDYCRSGAALFEYPRNVPADLIARFRRQHDEWHGRQDTQGSNPFHGTIGELRGHARPLWRSDEGLPGPWWQFDRMPQGSTMHLLAAADGSRSHRINIAWDKTGIFPWRWLNGGYRARDSVGELFRVQIRDFWFHFQNELAYLYFLDLNGDGHIDKQTELIGQVYYKTADSPLKESFARKSDVGLTQENTQEFTRNKTYVFRVGADPATARRDFLLCDAIEKLLPDAIHKGFGRDSHLGYIERARDDFILAIELSAARLHNASTAQDPLDWKRGVLELLRATGREYAAELEAYYTGSPEFPGLEIDAAIDTDGGPAPVRQSTEPADPDWLDEVSRARAVEHAADPDSTTVRDGVPPR